MQIAFVAIGVKTNGPLAAKIGSISNEIGCVLLGKRARQMNELRVVLIANKSNVHAISFLHEKCKSAEKYRVHHALFCVDTS